MRITLFTSNQPRHLSLANKLSSISEEVFCVQECTTVHPGKVEDFYKKSDIMQNYFQRVMNSEKELFGDISFSPKISDHGAPPLNQKVSRGQTRFYTYFRLTP